jgi:hypothetical protein
MRKKPIVIEMLMKAGVDVWYMDADVVPLEDFRVVKERQADVYIALGQTRPKRVSGSMMFFRNTQSAHKILQLYKEELQKSSLLDDEDALERIVNRPKLIRVLEPNHRHMYHSEEDDTVTTPTIRYLDPYAFISPRMYEQPSTIPSQSEHMTVHAHQSRDLQGMLRSFGIWFVEGAGCRTGRARVTFIST